jgi:hypothetical protein
MLYNITLGVGVLIIVIALFVFKQSLNFLKTAQRAEAVVVDIKKKVGGKGGTMYTPVFGFKTLDNREITYTPNWSSSYTSWKIGDVATIAYDADNPEKVRLVTYFGAFSLAIILLAIAMPLIVVGGGYYLAQPFLK